ncbi:integrase catalytic domain-containing protein [Trichonephila clavipes]|nr:integrase catalytic domain-containing protein [Trichonephila clavipes]
MQSLHPKLPKHHGKRPVFIHPGLLEATRVFLRRDMLRRPLQQPYDGPFKVLQRKDKVFFLDINGKRVSVSIDRCKPAFFLNTEDLQLPQTKNVTPATVEPNATASTPHGRGSRVVRTCSVDCGIGSNSFNAYPAIYTFWSQSSSSN